MTNKEIIEIFEKSNKCLKTHIEALKQSESSILKAGCAIQDFYEILSNCENEYEAVILAAEIVRNHDVVHAEWIKIDDGVDIGDGTHTECSNCKAWARVKTPYCSRCGSKMDGERKDGEEK